MNREVRKVFFIVNKYSGTGYDPALEGLVAESCRIHGVAFGLTYTEGRGHATALASEAVSQGYGAVVAVGGDGTVNEVAQGLVHTPVAMGILPKGSGNGLARHLGIPLKIPQALSCLFASKGITMDTFRLNGRLSLNVSGIGFDGYIAELFGMDQKRGLEGYIRLVMNEFIDFPEFEAEIQTGEKRVRKKAFVIALANSSQYGNNAKIAPSASICDGMLNLTVLKKVPPYRLDFVYSFFAGTVDESAYCQTLHVKDAKIVLHAPMSFHIDGEAAGKADTFQVELSPASLNILAPLKATAI